MEQFRDMAENSFGYGTWGAQYWFLGPEQGMSKDESEMLKRYEAWKRLGSLDLVDCIEFHREIECATWYGRKAKAQYTWTRLISVLIGYGAEGVHDRLEYQRTKWGTFAGSTCVIELSGMAAHSQQVKRHRSEFIVPRLAKITLKLRENKPELLVLYGRSDLCKRAWNEIASSGTHLGRCSNGAEVRKLNGTIVAWTDHTNARGRGRTYMYWQAFGKELREFQQRAE